MDSYPPTTRTQVRRLPKRGTYDKEQVHAILDEGYICHVGFVIDGQPFVIPTGYARFGDQLYIHGSSASRMLRSAGEGLAVCVTVTLVDGFVLARSVFHHSMNYRSVVGRSPAAHRSRVEGHQRPGTADRGSLGQSPHRPADRR
jgi:nitroimidazol reductase NimA-like FMN-containing flavoprotein (pyridoxamine 5'-phosphate oxidase superfamily)